MTTSLKMFLGYESMCQMSLGANVCNADRGCEWLAQHSSAEGQRCDWAGSQVRLGRDKGSFYGACRARTPFKRATAKEKNFKVTSVPDRNRDPQAGGAKAWGVE